MERFKSLRPIAVAMLFGLLLFCSGYTKIDAHAAINWIRVAGSNTNYDKDFTIKAGNGTVSYKKSADTLTLNNATIDASQMTPSHIDQKAGIEMYGGKWFGTSEFTIQLEGNNTIKVGKNQIGIYWDYVYVMRIKGSGTLTIDVSSSEGSYGLQPANGKVHIQDGATVNIVGNPRYGYYSHGVVSDSQLLIQGATFNVTGKEGAIWFDNSNKYNNYELGVRVESGTLTATATNGPAIKSYSGKTAAESAVLFVRENSEVTLEGKQAFYYEGTDYRYGLKIWQLAGNLVMEQGNSSVDIKDRTTYSDRQNDLYLYQTYGTADRALGSNPYIYIGRGLTRNINVTLVDNTGESVTSPARVSATLKKNGQVIGTTNLTSTSTSATFKDVSYTSTSRFSLDAKLYDSAGEDITSQYQVAVTGSETSGYTITVSGGKVEKDTLESITPPADITLAHGLEWKDIVACLPDVVSIRTTKGTENWAPIDFNTAEAQEAYDKDATGQQVFHITGTVRLPSGVVNTKGIGVNPSITVTVLEADKVGTPYSPQESGTYDTNLEVELKSSTADAEIYYTTDGSDPTTSSTKYTDKISLTGTKGQTVETTIQAIAVKSGMQNSGVATFTYYIALPEDPAVEIDVVDLSLNGPVAGSDLSGTGTCWTKGVATTAPEVTWTDAQGNVVTKAGYNTVYTATMTLQPDERYTFTNTTEVRVGGLVATAVRNTDGSLTVTYIYEATDKDRLRSFQNPQSIEVANGTDWDTIIGYLPDVVSITTEGGTAHWAPVEFDTDHPEPEYDPTSREEQTIVISGMVVCPDDIDPNGVDLDTGITVVICEASQAGAPYSPQESGIYDANQAVELISTEQGATVWYILDGADPVEYSDPIELTGTPGQSVTYTVEVYATKDGLRESNHLTYTYTIQLAQDAPAMVTIPAGECHHVYEWDTYKTATGTADGEMRYRCKYCGDVQYTVPVTAYYTFNKETQEKVLKAAQGATVKVQTPWFISFHEMVYKALQERPDVTLVVDYKNADALYEMTIPAGSGDQLQSLFGESQFAGFLYLGGTYATTELPKDTVFDGISATEMWFGTTTAH